MTSFHRMQEFVDAQKFMNHAAMLCLRFSSQFRLIPFMNEYIILKPHFFSANVRKYWK